MRQKLIILLALVLLVAALLPGCATVPAETTALSTTAPVETTTAPEETTLPPETTVPEETAAPEETFPIDEPLGRDSATPESLMQYPGLAWGCSIEDVIELFGLEEGEYESTLGGFGNRGSLTAANLEFFGALADELRFTFEDDGYGGSKLLGITARYPEDADMAAVRQQMEALYGAPNGYTLYDPNVGLMDPSFTSLPVVKECVSDEVNFYWSGLSMAEYANRYFTAKYVKENSTQNPERAFIYEEFVQANPVAYISLSTDYGNGNIVLGNGSIDCKNMVALSGQSCVEMDNLIAG